MAGARSQCSDVPSAGHTMERSEQKKTRPRGGWQAAEHRVEQQTSKTCFLYVPKSLPACDRVEGSCRLVGRVERWSVDRHKEQCTGNELT